MKKLLLFVVALGLAAFLFGAACGNDDDGNGAGSDDTSEGDGDAMAFDREITVRSLDRLAFEPDTIRVKVGERIRLVLDNEENAMLHDFSVHVMMPLHDVMMEGAEHGHGAAAGEFAMHVAAEAGEHGVLMFTATEAGEYEFFCSVAGHADAGMRGTIIVEA